MTGFALATLIVALLVGLAAPILMATGLVKSMRGRLAMWALVTLAGAVIWVVSDQVVKN